MIRGESKVTSSHLERAAIVYVRQSTLVQVREHTESTLRQYDLRDMGRAAAVGPTDPCPRRWNLAQSGLRRSISVRAPRSLRSSPRMGRSGHR